MAAGIKPAGDYWMHECKSGKAWSSAATKPKNHAEISCKLLHWNRRHAKKMQKAMTLAVLACCGTQRTAVRLRERAQI